MHALTHHSPAPPPPLQILWRQPPVHLHCLHRCVVSARGQVGPAAPGAASGGRLAAGGRWTWRAGVHEGRCPYGSNDRFAYFAPRRPVPPVLPCAQVSRYDAVMLADDDLVVSAAHLNQARCRHGCLCARRRACWSGVNATPRHLACGSRGLPCPLCRPLPSSWIGSCSWRRCPSAGKWRRLLAWLQQSAASESNI